MIGPKLDHMESACQEAKLLWRTGLHYSSPAAQAAQRGHRLWYASQKLGPWVLPLGGPPHCLAGSCASTSTNTWNDPKAVWHVHDLLREQDLGGDKAVQGLIGMEQSSTRSCVPRSVFEPWLSLNLVPRSINGNWGTVAIARLMHAVRPKSKSWTGTPGRHDLT